MVRQEASGLNVAAFCRERGVWSTCFFDWKRKLGAAGPPADTVAGFVETNAAPAVVPAPPALELDLGGGRRVTLRRGFGAELLRQLARALAGLG